MNVVNMKTLILNQTLSYALCTVVIALLWLQNRHRFAGLGFWLASFVMQTLGMMLIFLRETVPVWASVVGGNALLVSGLFFLYVGLERFVDRRSSPTPNLVLLVMMVAVHSYFTFVRPDLAARTINVSVALLIISFQIAWLLLHRVREMRTITRLVGFIFVGYGLVSVARIIVNIVAPGGNDFLYESGVPDILLVLAYQMVLVAATFGLLLMINRRLFLAFQDQQISLQESEARYRQLIELSPEAVLVYRDDTIIFVNPAALALLGAARPDELLGKPVLSFVHPDYRDLARARIDAALNQGRTAPLLEEKFIRVDGTVMDVEVTTARLLYQGQAALQSIARDITERKRVEEALRQSEEKYRVLAEGISDVIWVLDAETLCFTYVSPAVERLRGYTPEEVMADPMDAALTPEHAAYVRQLMGERLALFREGEETGQSQFYTGQVQQPCKDGSAVWTEVITQFLRNPQTGRVEVHGVTRDITERKRAEEQLEAYQHQLEAQNLELRKLTLAIEQSGNIIVITDTDGAIQYANPRFETVTGYTVNEVLGENPRLLKSGEQDAAFYQDLWDTITRGGIWRGEFHNKRKDGTLYWESATIAPVQDTDGRVTHYIAIKEDVTDRKEAEDALQRYAEQLAVQNAELDAFAQTVAHDLKNPLGLIIGYATFMEEERETLSPGELEQTLGVILRSSRKLDTIINELLLLAGVRKENVVPAPLAMAVVVQGALERLELVIEDKQAQMILPDPDAWPVALGHAQWVEEVWTNYVSNALKYGGDPPRVELGWDWAAEERTVRFWVRDNGAGIPPEAQAKLFTPFTRLGQVRVEGYGLGLSIVHRIVEKLGGKVGVESQVGEGSTFWFTLPAA